MKTESGQTTTIKEALAAAKQSLESNGLKNGAEMLAEHLLEGVLECRRFELHLNAERVLSTEQSALYEQYVSERGKGIPVQYLLGKAAFMDFTLQVTRDTLIPRPETELLVEQVVKHVKARVYKNGPKIMDVGTGSGNIAISVTSYLTEARTWAVDISEPALLVAKGNAARLEVAHRIQFLQSDLLKGIPPEASFDVIISNPPYLTEQELMQADIQLTHEPRQALVGGGEDGLLTIRKLAVQAKEHLCKEGVLFLEIGATQAVGVQELLRGQGFERIEIMQDYNGLDRMVKAWINS